MKIIFLLIAFIATATAFFYFASGLVQQTNINSSAGTAAVPKTVSAPFNQNQLQTTNSSGSKSSASQNFHGPTGQPYIIGPNGQPPNN